MREATTDVAYLVGTRGGSNDLALLEAVLPLIDRQMAAMVDATGNVMATSASEKCDGLSTESWLRLCARQTYGDAKTLTLVADTLRSMPNTPDRGDVGCECGAAPRLSRGRMRAEGLVLLSETYLTADGTPRRARPSMILTADTTTNPDDGDGADGLAPVGQLLWASHAGPITLSGAALQRLACEADVTLVLRDGRRIIGTLSDDRYATDAQRRMLTARDHHCFPGCRAPAVISIAHHVIPWPHGPTELPNLALLCPLHHHVVHHRGWAMTIDDDAVCVFRRARRIYTTYPADLRRLRPRDGPHP